LFGTGNLTAFVTAMFSQLQRAPACGEGFHVQRCILGIWPAGYLINPNVEPLDQKWLKEFSKIPAAGVSDGLGPLIQID